MRGNGLYVYSLNRVWTGLALLACAALIAGCSPAGGRINGLESQTPTQTPASQVVETAAAAPAQTSPGPGPTPTPGASHPATGLALGSPNQTFFVDPAGQVSTLAGQPRARLSPDLATVLFSRPDPQSGMNDVWLLARASGEERNLTQTPDRDEVSPQWWPAHPEIVFFGSGTGSGMENAENPTVVGLDGSGYRLLDEEHGGPASLSPDGSAIAYGGFGPTARIYHWDGQGEAFDPSDYGLMVDSLSQPAYSPDGRYLAWQVNGDLGGDGSLASGVAVFDLEEHTARLLHVYSPQGGGMVPHTIAWSPDGSQIATVTFGEAPATGREPNLWVIQSDGSGETYVDAGLEPVWSADGAKLAYLKPGPDGMPELRIVEAGSWAPVDVSGLAFPEPPQFIMDWLK